jgi:hypothetical protein
MKNKLYVLVCITALSVLPLAAGDGEAKSVSVEQRLREMDLSLALRQYERVKMEAFETDLKLTLLPTDEDLTEPARKKRAQLLTERLQILEQRADKLRAIVLEFGEQTPVATAK